MGCCSHKFSIPDYQPKRKSLSFFVKLDLFLIFLVVLDILTTTYALSIGGYIEANPIMADVIVNYGFIWNAMIKLIEAGFIVLVFQLFDLFLTKGIGMIKAVEQIKKIGTFLGNYQPLVSFAVRAPAIGMASFIVIGNVITLL